jgi:hypothetical protein
MSQDFALADTQLQRQLLVRREVTGKFFLVVLRGRRRCKGVRV